MSSPRSDWVLKGSELHVDRSSPLGATKCVFLGSWQNRPVAVKLLSESASTEVLASRLELWERLSHPNVLKVFGSPLYPDDPCLVLQYHSNGNARQYILQHPNPNRLSIIQQTASGMQYLHINGIVHGSLKPSNVLIQGDGTACIADADLVKIQPSSSPDSHRYYSPEAWKGNTSKPSDVFAFAMTAYELFTSEMPWGVLAEKQIRQFVVYDDLRPDRPDVELETRVGLTDRIWALLEEAWHKDPRMRCTFSVIPGMLNVDLNASFLSLSTDGSPQDVSPPKVLQVSTIHDDDGPPPPSYEAAIVPPTPIQPPPVVQPLRINRANRPSTADGGNQRDPSWLQDSRMSTFSGSNSSLASGSRPATSGGRPPSQASFASASTRVSAPRFQMPRIQDAPSSSRSWEQSAANSQQSFTSSDTDHHLSEPPMTAPFSQNRFDQWSPPPTSSLRPNSTMRQSHRWDAQSFSTGATSFGNGAPNPVLLVQALQVEVKSYQNEILIDSILVKIQHSAFQNANASHKLVTAGVISTLIDLLNRRAVYASTPNVAGLLTLLTSIGLLAHDSISANTLFRTGTTATLIHILDATENPDLIALTTWCLIRVCRSAEIASGIMKQGAVRLFQRTLRSDHPIVAQYAAWALGSLVHNDAGAEELATMSIIPELVHYLHLRSTSQEDAEPHEVSAAAFGLARISRSIKLAKQISKAGALPLLAHHMNQSVDPLVLNWVCRTVGCLMRPNSGEMAKGLLEAGVARGLARVPSVLESEEVEPLGSFAFAIQRFSCAEWGGGTRKALMDAGAVDALLAALRTASSEPFPQVHIELALAVSFLGDVGGASLRKEVVNAGGIEILKQVAADGDPAVAKACTMAVTSITGNLWTRNAASAKTAMNHNWSGGCPDYHPPCPVPLGVLDEE